MASKKNLSTAKKTADPKLQKPKDSDTKIIKKTDKVINERQSHYTFKAVAPDED